MRVLSQLKKELQMKLHGQEFGHVFCASGSRNFYGQGYPFHWLARPFGLDYSNSTLIGKTGTMSPTLGNMHCEDDGMTPRELLPRCIIVLPLKGVTLNAVGLSNIGLPLLMTRGGYTMLMDPFVLSFMAIGKTRTDRRGETVDFVKLLKIHEKDFYAPYAVQVNWSCPNVGHSQDELIEETGEMLSILAALERPIIGKVNALLTIESAALISQNPVCSALSVSNTIPYGQLPDKIDWVGLFGEGPSPLTKRGFSAPGGLGGFPLHSIVVDWIRRARAGGINTPIIGGSNFCSTDADETLDAGANAIELGSVSLLRPWRVRGIISHVNARFAAQGVRQ